MQPVDEIAFSAPSVLTHAGHVDAIADEVDVARAAAAQIRADAGAYGQVCAFVPPFLNGLSEDLMTGLEGAVTSLRDTGTRLRAIAGKLTTANLDATADITAAGE